MQTTERLFTPKQLAEIAGISPATIKREAARGRLRYVRIGEARLLRIPESAWRGHWHIGEERINAFRLPARRAVQHRL